MSRRRDRWGEEMANGRGMRDVCLEEGDNGI